MERKLKHSRKKNVRAEIEKHAQQHIEPKERT